MKKKAYVVLLVTALVLSVAVISVPSPASASSASNLKKAVVNARQTKDFDGLEEKAMAALRNKLQADFPELDQAVLEMSASMGAAALYEFARHQPTLDAQLCVEGGAKIAQAFVARGLAAKVTARHKKIQPMDTCDDCLQAADNYGEEIMHLFLSWGMGIEFSSDAMYMAICNYGTTHCSPCFWVENSCS